jgi:Peptidase family M28
LDSPKEPGLRPILFSLAVLAAILAVSILGLRPPSAKPSTAPATEFSAARAQDVLHRVLGPDEPHPIGSPANDAVRSRVVAELTQFGYQTQVQAAFACAGYGRCASVRNVLARLDGTDARGGAVLLAAHYDSVPAAPGDSDDGTGVAAVLEIARALKSLPRPRHSVVLLIDDGEEAGLLGARGFVDSHPWAKEVRAAVNVDARGTSGPSLMFETGSANEWAVRFYARHATRPITSSIFYTAYKRLPNGTDFTLFKDAGYQGLNFAFIGDEVHYHTALDNSANVSLRSLQQQGDNALASVEALANSDLRVQPARKAVYFDLFGRVVVRWPSRWTIIFALAAALLLIGQLAWMIRRKRVSFFELRWGFIAWPVTMIAITVLAVVLRWLLWIGGATPVNWTAHPLPSEIAFWSLAAAVVMTSAAFFATRAGFWGLWSGVWSWWALLSILTALLASGLSYVFLVPLIVAALAGLPATLWRNESARASSWGTSLPMFAAGIVIFPPVLLLYPGFGARAFVTISILTGLILTPIAPFCAELRGAGGVKRRMLHWTAILAMAAAACLAVIVPVYSAKSPERLNLKYWLDADSGNSEWIVVPASGRLPEPLRVAANLGRSERSAFPWENQPSFVTSAPSVALAAPTFTVLESSQSGSQRMFSALLRSERGAPEATVFFPASSGLDSVRIEGQPIEPESPATRELYSNNWFLYACPAMPASGIQIEFSLPVGKPVEVLVADQSYGLPPEGAFLVNARPLTATRSQEGDVTVVTRRVQLNP